LPLKEQGFQQDGAKSHCETSPATFSAAYFFLRGTDYPLPLNSLDLTPFNAYLGRVFKE
jgi:hypothetical protein